MVAPAAPPAIAAIIVNTAISTASAVVFIRCDVPYMVKSIAEDVRKPITEPEVKPETKERIPAFSKTYENKKPKSRLPRNTAHISMLSSSLLTPVAVPEFEAKKSTRR